MLIFLPVTITGFYVIGNRGHERVAVSWLVAASFFFYAWWNPVYLLLLLGSIIFNYSYGLLIGSRHSKALLIIGITVNLGLLGYFKYANFFVANLNAWAQTHYYLETIVLPLAISFFTFQQISYLVDAYRGETRENSFLHYCLFVSFFPQLIAGPIVHHKEMLPQFSQKSIFSFSHKTLAVGLTLFLVGLCKKTILADGIAVYATPVFQAAARGSGFTIFEAWLAAFSYTFQLYFDFSGYSDMAIGLAQMFGIRLPINFYSPLKATSIIDFWRRWHITLSRFLFEYVYIPLGGNRRGSARMYVNLMITMFLGGIWHGAGWTFMLWGILHGFYLLINNTWRRLRIMFGHDPSRNTWWGTCTAGALTFTAVVVGFVIFRADTLASAAIVLKSMAGLNGFALPASAALPNLVRGWRMLALLAGIAWLVPNMYQLMSQVEPVINIYRGKAVRSRQRWLDIHWQPSAVWACITGIIGLFAILFSARASEFLYYQF